MKRNIVIILAFLFILGALPSCGGFELVLDAIGTDSTGTIIDPSTLTQNPGALIVPPDLPSSGESQMDDHEMSDHEDDDHRPGHGHDD